MKNRRWNLRVTVLASAWVGMLLLPTAGCADDEGDPRDDPCQYITCNGHGTCQWSAAKIPYCVCDEHYELDPDDPTRCRNDGSINDCRGPL